MNEARLKSLDEMREWVQSLQDFDQKMARNAQMHTNQLKQYEGLIKNLEQQNAALNRELEDIKKKL